jgi:hypothetical protein
MLRRGKSLKKVIFTPIARKAQPIGLILLNNLSLIMRARRRGDFHLRRAIPTR